MSFLDIYDIKVGNILEKKLYLQRNPSNNKYTTMYILCLIHQLKKEEEIDEYYH